MSLAAEYDDLDHTLSGPEPDFDAAPEAPQGAEHADWLLRRLARTRRHTADVRTVAAAERDRIDTWEAGRLDQLVKQEAWLTDALAQYHRAVLAREPKRKSIDLPFGKLVSRNQQPEWDIDPDVFLPWAAEHAPELVNPGTPKPPVPAPDRAAVKKALVLPGDPKPGDLVHPVTPDGVVPPGVAVLIREPKFVAETPEVQS